MPKNMVTIDGNEAARIGMVSELAEDPVAKAMNIATTISEQAPLAVQNTLKNARLGLVNQLEAIEALTPAAIRLMKTDDAHCPGVCVDICVKPKPKTFLIKVTAFVSMTPTRCRRVFTFKITDKA